jgi:uncharacterized protein YaaW (UPF0174 family)
MSKYKKGKMKAQDKRIEKKIIPNLLAKMFNKHLNEMSSHGDQAMADSLYEYVVDMKQKNIVDEFNYRYDPEERTIELEIGMVFNPGLTFIPYKITLAGNNEQVQIS